MAESREVQIFLSRQAVLLKSAGFGKESLVSGNKSLMLQISN